MYIVLGMQNTPDNIDSDCLLLSTIISLTPRPNYLLSISVFVLLNFNCNYNWWHHTFNGAIQWPTCWTQKQLWYFFNKAQCTIYIPQETTPYYVKLNTTMTESWIGVTVSILSLLSRYVGSITVCNRQIFCLSLFPTHSHPWSSAPRKMFEIWNPSLILKKIGKGTFKRCWYCCPISKTCHCIISTFVFIFDYI